jgi:hypothetical protein
MSDPTPAVQVVAPSARETPLRNETGTLVEALTRVGAQIQLNDVIVLQTIAERCRSSYAVYAVLLGIALLAKKALLPHGAFKQFCNDSLRKSAPTAVLGPNGTVKSAAGAALLKGESQRSAQVYMLVARRLLDSFTSFQFNHHFVIRLNELRASGDTMTAPRLVELTVSGRDEAIAWLTEFTDGWSLRQLLTLLNQADREADAPAPLPRKERDAAPTDFFSELESAIAHLRQYREDPLFLTLEPAQALLYAAALEAEAKTIRAAVTGQSAG